MPAAPTSRLIRSCPTCHNLDRDKIFYWKGGPSRHRMFKRYYNNSDYHSLRVTLSDLKFSASRECSFCVIAFDAFRWLSRTKGDGPQAVVQAKVEICIPFSPHNGHPLVLTYSWLPCKGAPIAREYDLQLSVPTACPLLPWSTLTVGHQIPKDPKTSFFRAASWLRTCLTQHDDNICGHGRGTHPPNVMPHRLIFIGEHEKQTRLVECHDLEVQVPYTALSYCWGPTGHASTTKATYLQQLLNIPWATIPRTHRDAMEFTRALGYRYIWIDSLCIIQDDIADWEHEASAMGNIYRNAILTISATNSNHAGFGCLTERPGSRSFRNKLQRQAGEPTHVLVHEPVTHANLITNPRPEEEWPVFRRAWTLQERLLATRIIYFNAGELAWECGSSCACECGHMDRKGLVTPRMKYNPSSMEQMTTTEAAQTWDDLALSYQNRLLSQETDRFSALSGMAQRFQQFGLGDYVAGIWTNYALSMMLWEVKVGHRGRGYVAPSWSWASVQGRLFRNDPIEPNEAFEAIFHEAKSDKAGDDPCGAIASASITISTPVYPGVVSMGGRHGHAMVELDKNVRAFFVGDGSDESFNSRVRVHCAFFRGLNQGPSHLYIEGLVLRLSKDMKTYERIGMAHITKHSLEYLHTLNLTTEKITMT